MLYVHEIPRGMKEGRVRCRIRQLRRVLLVHSYLYYSTDKALVTDSQWDAWAKELVWLQSAYPYIGQFLEYHEAFKDFDGSTGYNLPWNDNEIVKVANNLVRNNINEKRKTRKLEKTAKRIRRSRGARVRKSRHAKRHDK